MSTMKMYKVQMLMDKGGLTWVIVGAMNRAHATGVARQQNPGWKPTGHVEEM